MTMPTLLATAATSADSGPGPTGKDIRYRIGVMRCADGRIVPVISIICDDWSRKTLEVARTKAVVRRVWAGIRGGHFCTSPSPRACSTCPYAHACRQWES
jgi:hypothetical protein